MPSWCIGCSNIAVESSGTAQLFKSWTNWDLYIVILEDAIELPIGPSNLIQENTWWSFAAKGGSLALSPIWMAIVKCNHSWTCAPFLLFFELRHCQILTRLPGVRPFHAGELFVTLLVGKWWISAVPGCLAIPKVVVAVVSRDFSYFSLYNFYKRISGFLCPLVLHERLSWTNSLK